jgi:hypothetical protein
MPPDPLTDPANGPLELGWPEVRSGLHHILLGYLIALGSIALTVLAIFYIGSLVLSGHVEDAVIDAGMLIFFGGGLMLLLGTASVTLVVAGKVRCLLNVPERAGAKWLLFCAVLCFMIGPGLDTASQFIPSKVDQDKIDALMRKHAKLFDGKPGRYALVAEKGKSEAAVDLFNELRSLVLSLIFLDTKAYVTLGGIAAGLLHTVFFVLFLRSVAQCWDDTARRVFAELYLAFILFLLGSSLYVIFYPPPRLEELGMMVLALAVGWLICLLWYLLLIVSTSMGIARGLALRQMDLLMRR